MISLAEWRWQKKDWAWIEITEMDQPEERERRDLKKMTEPGTCGPISDSLTNGN